MAATSAVDDNPKDVSGDDVATFAKVKF